MNKFRGTREFAFEMSHALFMLEQEPYTNLSCYGRDVEPHGHNWKLQIEIEGPKHPEHQMIYDLSKLDKLFKKQIDVRYDHRYFDINILDRVPTIENLTRTMWNGLVTKCDYLHQIQLYEYPYIWTTYGGQDMYLNTSYQFSAQHRTHNTQLHDIQNQNYYGKCNRYHGHNYSLVVTLKGPVNEKTGLIVNRVSLDKCMNSFIETYLAHKTLNKIPGLQDTNATTENILEVLWNLLLTHLVRENIIVPKDHRTPRLYRLRLHETDRNYFDYFGPDKEEVL